MIPAFNPQGNLPPGIHNATWKEFVVRFGRVPRRRYLLAGLTAALESLRAAGCRSVYINGSFVTAKRSPGDFDGCWDAEGMDLERLDPVLLSFAQGRAAQKAKYRGELFPTDMSVGGDVTFLDFFQIDRETGEAKGIVRIHLGTLQP